MNYSIKNDFYTLTVSDKGAEMISLVSNSGYEFIWNNPDGNAWNDHAPLLFPMCGSLDNETYTLEGKSYKLKQHGFAMDSKFTLEEKTDTSLTFSLSENEETLKSFPFNFKFVAKYELRGEELLLNVTVTNNSNRVMPYMFGWHPGFNLPTDNGQDINDYKAEFPGIDALGWFQFLGEGYFPRTAQHYPLKNQAYQFCEDEIYRNDTMIFNGHNYECKVYADGHPYSMFMKWSKNIPTLCIWKTEKNSAKFICIEPWASVPKDGKTDADFDIRPMPRLAPSESETYTYTVIVNKK